MIFFVTFRQINDRIRELYEHTGEEPNPSVVMMDLYRRGQYIASADNQDLIRQLADCGTEDFLREKEDLYIECNTEQLEYLERHPEANRAYAEVLRLSERRSDLFLNFRFPRSSSQLHPHPAFFEIDYVYAGAYILSFEERKYILKPGDLCIVSPKSRHMIRELDPSETQGLSAEKNAASPDCVSSAPEDADADLCLAPEHGLVIQQYLDHASLHSTFISLLSDDNIVSNFFKNILTNENYKNFLLLSTGTSKNFSYIQRIAKDIFLEQFKYDDYSPGCNLNLLKILFSNVLRSYQDSYQLYNGNTDIDFVPILRYLEKNYRTTSLNETARLFHYSPSHLSACIKQVTGKTYTEMIRNLKMNEAGNYLLHSNKPIEEISRLVGYKTVDHFSRAFRQYYGTPPSQYRKKMKETQAAIEA